MSYISSNLNFLIMSAKKAGKVLARDFSEIEQLQSSIKGHQSFVKASIDKLNLAFQTELAKGRPDYAYVTDGKLVEGPQFLVTPLDGILNYAHGIPYYALSIAVVENGIITSGIIYNPTSGDLYFAEKGQGAFREGFRNHERLRVSVRKDFVGAIVSADNVEFPKDVDVRSFGCVSLDLAYLSSGKLDAVVRTDNNISSIAAGILIVKEAGGQVLEFNQKDIRTDDLSSVLESGNIIAVNANLSKKVHELFN